MKAIIKEYQETKNEACLERVCIGLKPIARSIAVKYVCSIRDLEVEDIQQELLMEVPRLILEFDVEKDVKFSTYMYAVMNNKALKIIRKERAQKRNPGRLYYLETPIRGTGLKYENVLSDSTDLEYECELEEQKRINDEFLSTVLKEEELVLYLDHVEGMSLKEMSEKYNIEKNKIRNKINYIKRKLRILKDKYNERIK